MGFLHAPELVLLIIVALVIFGPKRLPEIGSALGKGIKEFKRGTSAEPEESPVKTEPVQIPAVQSTDVRVPQPSPEPVASVNEREAR